MKIEIEIKFGSKFQYEAWCMFLVGILTEFQKMFRSKHKKNFMHINIKTFNQ